MGRKNKTGYTLSDDEKLALRVVINSGELDRPVNGINYIYDVTDWFTPKENGRRDEEASAEFYTMCHGDQVFGTYIEGNKDSKTERQFCESVERAGYVQQIGDGYYLWAAEVQDKHGEVDVWNRQQTMEFIDRGDNSDFHPKTEVPIERTSEYNSNLYREDGETRYVRLSDLDRVVSKDDEGNAYVEIPASNAKGGNTERVIAAVEKVGLAAYNLPEDDPRRIKAEQMTVEAEQMSVRIDGGYSMAYIEDGVTTSAKQALKEKGYETPENPEKPTPAEMRSFNSEMKSFIREANENGTVSEGYSAVEERTTEAYEAKHVTTTTEADRTVAINLMIDENANTAPYYLNVAESQIAAQEAQHYLEVTTVNTMRAERTFLNPDQQPTVVDAELPGYAQYIEKKEDHVETQRDEATRDTIRATNSINIEVRNDTIQMVREYTEQHPNGCTNVELMRDPEYAQLMQDIKSEIIDGGRREVDTIDSGLRDLAILTSPGSSDEQIAAMVSSEINGLTYNDRIMNNAATLDAKVEKVIHDDIVQGKSYTQIKNDITNVFNSAGYANGRLITTEAARVEDRAIKEALKEEGVEEVEVIAESDACEECLALTGKTYSIDDAPEIPVHPNCRCVIRAIVKK